KGGHLFPRARQNPALAESLEHAVDRGSDERTLGYPRRAELERLGVFGADRDLSLGLGLDHGLNRIDQKPRVYPPRFARSRGHVDARVANVLATVLWLRHQELPLRFDREGDLADQLPGVLPEVAGESLGVELERERNHPAAPFCGIRRRK